MRLWRTVEPEVGAHAIRASLDAGIPSDQIAAKLHVKISDLEWMSRLTTVAPAA
ncbi:hypothetical protein FRAHR75_510006 [Frankia sp. Hr75.2]|nr:hypothetical protein FRAHR75_510006 [Frankia sp. Hr75.2]